MKNKADKKIKTVYPAYTLEERKEELEKVKTQLYSIGFDTTMEHFVNMFKVIDDYIETGTPVSGVIKLEGYEREFLYLFPETKKHKIQCMLKYVKDL